MFVWEEFSLHQTGLDLFRGLVLLWSVGPPPQLLPDLLPGIRPVCGGLCTIHVASRSQWGGVSVLGQSPTASVGPVVPRVPGGGLMLWGLHMAPCCRSLGLWAVTGAGGMQKGQPKGLRGKCLPRAGHGHPISQAEVPGQGFSTCWVSLQGSQSKKYHREISAHWLSPNQ